MTAQTATAPATAAGLRRSRLEKRLGLPPRPKTRQMGPDTAWMTQAVCASAPERDRLAFVTVERQDDATDLVEGYCERCPVADACLADGRRSHLHGLAGGYVLADGHLAQDAAGDAAYRSGVAWDRDEVAEPVARPLTAVPEPLEMHLVDLARQQGSSVTAAQAAAALEKATGRRPTTKTARRHLEALEEAGHLTREPAPADGRRRIGRWSATKPPRRGQRWQPRRKNRRRGRR